MDPKSSQTVRAGSLPGDRLSTSSQVRTAPQKRSDTESQPVVTKPSDSTIPDTVVTRRKVRPKRVQEQPGKVDPARRNLFERDKIKESISDIAKFDDLIPKEARSKRKIPPLLRTAGVITFKHYRKIHEELKKEIKPLEAINQKKSRFPHDVFDYFNNEIRAHLEKLLKGINLYLENPFTKYKDINSEGYYLRQFIDTTCYQLLLQKTIISDIEIVLRLYEYAQAINTRYRTVLYGTICEESIYPEDILKILGLKVKYDSYEDNEQSVHLKEKQLRAFRHIRKPSLISADNEIIEPYLLLIHRNLNQFTYAHLRIHCTLATAACNNLQQFIQYLGAESVVEIMAGSGYLARALEDTGMQVKACDIATLSCRFTAIAEMDAKDFIDSIAENDSALRQCALLIAAPAPNAEIYVPDAAGQYEIPHMIPMAQYLPETFQKWYGHNGGPVIIFSECTAETELYDAEKLRQDDIFIEPLSPVPDELITDLGAYAGTAKAFKLVSVPS